MFVITGGSRGIGRALALSLAAQHHPVLIIGREQKTLDTVAKKNASIQTLAADIATEEGQATLIQALTQYKTLKGFIHNAGAISPIQSIQTLPADAWLHIMNLNLNAPFFLTQALYSQLTGGRVLHIGSGAAHFAVAGWAPYCVSKAGLSMLTKAWQLECPDMATAFVMPGIVATEMQATIRTSTHQHPEKVAFFQNLYDQKQLITPETVASFLTWLLLNVDETRYVSQEWDIYDVSHHPEWLKPPHQVPALD